MLPDFVAAAASALVGSMVTDGWARVKVEVSQLFARGESGSSVERRLDATREAVMEADADPMVLAEAEAAWRVRLTDLLDEHPELANDLQMIIDQARGPMRTAAVAVVQHAMAHDDAQQAIQGHGIQANRFRHGS